MFSRGKVSISCLRIHTYQIAHDHIYYKLNCHSKPLFWHYQFFSHSLIYFEMYIRVNRGVSYTIKAIKPLIFQYPVRQYWPNTTLLYMNVPPSILHSKSKIDWNSSVSETNISLQNRYSCMYLMENNLKHFYDINVIWNK